MAERSTPPALLDRLLDDAPQEEGDLHPSTWWDPARHKETLARDLELLLNTRCSFPSRDELEPYPLARHSFLTFGLMDFSGLSLKNPEDQEHMKAAIQEAITCHEPRLTRVRVTLEPDRGGHRMLHFRVDAHLRLQPGQPSVSFDAQLQVTSGAYQVRS